MCDTLAPARATFIFRASLVQTGQRTPAPAGKGIRLLQLLPLAGVGQGQGVFLNKTQPNHSRAKYQSLEPLTT